MRSGDAEPRMRSVGFAVVALITAAAAVAAAIFADSSQAVRVATDGSIHAEGQRVITAANAVKGNLGLTVIIVSAEQSAVVLAEDVRVAITRVQSDLATLEDHAAALDDLMEGSGILDQTSVASAAVADTLARIATAHEELSASGSPGDTDPTALLDDVQYDAARVALETVEQTGADIARQARTRIQAERSRAGDAARISSLVVALIIPAGAAWSLSSATRRREERLRLRAELDKSVSLVRARDDLIAGLSHQLRTPLTAIAGYAQTMLENPDDLEFVVEGLTVVEGQAADLSRMVDDLVTMARLDDGPVATRMEAVDVVREIEAVLSGNVTWGSVQTSLSPATVWMDRIRLRHIVNNLVANAIRHGGDSVIVKAAPVDGVYRIAVADDGDGVPSELIDTMFEPYVHSARDALVTGTLGLGLAVAKRLAEQMGCRLRYERTNGYTLFVLDVPMAMSAQLPPARPVATI